MLELRPYQQRSVDLLSQWGKGILGHDPGLGKTAIAIRALDALDVRRGILVVTTSSSLWNWKREFERWQTIRRDVRVMDGGGHVNIVPYSWLSNNHDVIRWARTAGGMQSVIFDEAHALKSPTSNRTRAAYLGDKARGSNPPVPPLVAGVPHVFALTGTLLPNNYAEAWPHLQCFIPNELRRRSLDSFVNFRDHFCEVKQTTFGPRIVANRNAEQLKALLQGTLHRYRKQDVLQDLPPLQFSTVPIDVPGSATKALSDALARLGLGGPVQCSLEDLIKQAPHLSTERRLLGLAKLEPVANFVTDLLQDNDDKAIVFAHHKEVLTELAGKLMGFRPVAVQGNTPPAQRQALVDAFQTDPTRRVFLGQLTAAGEAITLTAARHVIFAEYAWTPSINWQAACRAHRIGQSQGVLAQVLVAKDSLDEYVGQVVASKAQAIADIFG